MGLDADAGTTLNIAGDAGGRDDDSDASVNGSMRIEGDAGGGDGDHGESGTSGPDGMDLDLGGRDARHGSDGDGGEVGSMGLEADAGAVSEVEGGIDGAGEAAALATAIGPGTGRDAALVGPDKKKKKKRGPRGGKQTKHGSTWREKHRAHRDAVADGKGV